MRILRRSLALVVALGVLVALPAGRTFAYGAADQPLAQLEFSGNCDNPTFPFCANVVGVGGIWLWIEVDADQTADYSGSVCEHTAGSPGAGGATPLRGEGTWFYSTGVPLGTHLTAVDPNNQYYVVALNPQLSFAFPVTPGHYSNHPAPGVSQETEVAP